jgi:hypothetical protein
MSAGKYSFIVEQGSTKEFEVRYADSGSNPIDLSYYSARMQIRDSPGSPNLYATLSSSLLPDGTGLNLNGMRGDKPTTSGSIGVYISAATSSMFTFNEASYDIELVSGSYVTRILEGKIKLSREVTING